MFQADLLELAVKQLQGKKKNECTEGEHSVLVISALIRQAIPINIQPVADYLYHGTEQEDWYLEKDFPNLAPPWELAWYHWDPPTWVRSEGTVIQSPMMQDYDYGCLVVGLTEERLFRDVGLDAKHLLAPPDAKWLAAHYLFGRNKKTNVITWYSLKFFVNKQGEPLFPADGQYKTGLFISDPLGWPKGDKRKFIHGDGPFSPKSKFRNFELVESELNGILADLKDQIADRTGQPKPERLKQYPPYENDVIGTLFPVFMATSFCHCKNVEVKDIPIPDKVLKKRNAKGAWSPKIRREIHIEPMKKVLRATPGTQPGDIKRQLVIRRGHFKDFKEGRGLFGKHHGLYWWENWVKDASNVKYQVEGMSK